jgi:hypothetical protein
MKSMTTDPIIGRLVFVDGIVRAVFVDVCGEKYVIDQHGHTRV